MTETSLLDEICDKLSAPQNLKIKPVNAVDGGVVVYKVTFVFTLSRAAYDKAFESGRKQRRSALATLRRQVLSAFKFCFADDET